MASPQVENGFTRIANELFQAILEYDCPGNQRDIIWAIIRMSYGYQSTECELAVGYLAKMLKRDKATISRDVKSLIEKKVINVLRESTFSKPRIVSLNKNYEEWRGFKIDSTVAKNSTVDKTSTQQLEKSQFNSCESINSTVDKTSTIKENIKTTRKKQKENIIQLFPTSVHPLQNFVKESCLRVAKLEKQLTFEEAESLLKDFPEVTIKETLLSMENYTKLKNYTSVNLTLRNWLTRNNSANKTEKKNGFTPKVESEQQFAKLYN